MGSYLGDYATARYDPAGTEVWVARYNSPANGWDQARARRLPGGPETSDSAVGAGTG